MAYITKCIWCDGKGYVEICPKCGDLGMIVNIKDDKIISTEDCDCKTKEIIEKICHICEGRGQIVESSARYYPKNYPDVLKPIG